MKKLVLLLLCAVLASCSIYSPSNSNISKKDTYLYLTIIQTHSEHQALAWTEDYDVVKVMTYGDTYYDGKKLSGRYILIDTYTYTTKDGIVKTVPVFILKSEYKWFLQTHKKI